MTQQPDTSPGNYYVSVADAGRVGLLVGPFRNDHAAALAYVERAREAAEAADPWAHFYAFGTVKAATDRPGRLNDRVGYRPRED